MAGLLFLLLVSLSLTKVLPTSEVAIDPKEYEELHQRHRRSSPPVILPDLVVDPEINEGAYQGDMILAEEQTMERNTRKLTPSFLSPTEVNYSLDEITAAKRYRQNNRHLQVLDGNLLTTHNSKWKADVSFSEYCKPMIEIRLGSSKTGDCLLVKKGSIYFYRNPSYPAADSPGFDCSLSFAPSEMASYTLSVVFLKGKDVFIKYWKPKNLFVKLSPTGKPVTQSTSGGKLQVKSSVPKKNPKDVKFNIMIGPRAANQVVKLVEGQEQKFVYNSDPGTESAEYRFEAPEGKRVRIKFLEFNVGSAKDKKCKKSNYLLVGKSEDFFYKKMYKYCDDFKSAASKKIVSVGNAMSLYVERKYDVEESFVAKVKAIN